MMMTHPYFNSLRPDTTKMTGLVKTACICSAITLYPLWRILPMGLDGHSPGPYTSSGGAGIRVYCDDGHRCGSGRHLRDL